MGGLAVEMSKFVKISKYYTLEVVNVQEMESLCGGMVLMSTSQFLGQPRSIITNASTIINATTTPTATPITHNKICFSPQ